MKRVIVLIPVIGLISISGCCGMFHGDSQTLTFNSNPEGVEIQVGSYSGKTPFTTPPIPKGQDIRIIAEYNGLEINQIVTKRMDHIFWLNYFTLFIGGAVDAGSGAMYMYDPDTYFFNFTPQKIPTAPN